MLKQQLMEEKKNQYLKVANEYFYVITFWNPKFAQFLEKFTHI
jgi:hypothetical protein